MTIMMAAALVAAGQSSDAATTSAMQPQGKWEVAYNKDDCLLGRRFEGGGRSIVLEMEPAISADGGLIALILEHDTRRGLHRGKGAIVVSPSGASFPVEWASVELAPAHERAVRLFTDEAVWQALRNADGVEVKAGTEVSAHLALGSTGAAFTALAACRSDLLKSWGVDEVTMIEPVQDLRQLFTSNAYPPEALRTNQQGAVGVVVRVDRAGRPAACRVVISSKSPPLDMATCSIMRTTRFPAAPDGPETRTNFTQVRWLLPGR